MINYREEIDGLRALAVMSVILYHIGLLNIVPGGYVGVDIFFVISGYLITTLIIEDLDTGRFSFAHFYERRCRRILPALYFISSINCFFAFRYMSPPKLKEYGYTIISMITFSSNIYFWRNDDQYFSRMSDFNPLIHTWSLAVEEQFYIVFPILCYGFMNRRKCLLVILWIAAFSSLFFAQWGGNLQIISRKTFYMFLQHRFASFYMPFGRIWELLAGSFIAFYVKADGSIG